MEEFKMISADEISELLEFASRNKESTPDRLMEVLFYGICASQLSEACLLDFNSKAKRKESFELTQQSACVLVPNTPMSMLMSYVQFGITAMHLKSSGSKLNKAKEKDYQGLLIERFSSAFPYLDFVASEVRPSDDDRDRIDILAKTKDNNRDVIIELKLGKRSAHKQLRSYAYGFNDPILINVSEEDVDNKRDGIIYKTFSEIGVSL